MNDRLDFSRMADRMDRTQNRPMTNRREEPATTQVLCDFLDGKIGLRGAEDALIEAATRYVRIEREALPAPLDVDGAWHEFVNVVYRLIPDGDIRGPIIGAAARLSIQPTTEPAQGDDA